MNRCGVFWFFFFEKKPKALHDVKDMLCALPGLCHLPGSLNSSFLAAPWEKGGRSRIEVRVCVCMCVRERCWLRAQSAGAVDNRALGQNNAETEKSGNLCTGCQQDRESSRFTLQERNPGEFGKLHKHFQVVNEKRQFHG